MENQEPRSIAPPTSLNIKNMTTVEIAEAMEDALDNMTAESYDATIIDAYMEELEKRAPMPKLMDTDLAYKKFKNVMQECLLTENPQTNRSHIFTSRSFRKGFVLVAAVLCVLGGLLSAQAAGVDILGIMANWTENVFSLGQMPDAGATDILLDTEKEAESVYATETAYNSVQEALNIYGITDISEPQWFPEGYTLDEVTLIDEKESDIFVLNAVYVNADKLQNIGFSIMKYSEHPFNQIEKSNIAASAFTINGTTYYLIKNECNHAVAWATNDFECYLYAPTKEDLLKIVNSMLR